MDLNKFDKQFKSSLENLEAPYEPASWGAFESRLDAALSEEQPAAVESVDLAVRKALDRFEVPYQSSDWHLLSDKLNKLQVARRVRYTKLAEAAIFLLLLINVEGFMGGFKEVTQPKAPSTHQAPVPMADGARSHKSRKNTGASENGVAVSNSAAEQGIAGQIFSLLASALTGESSPTEPTGLPGDSSSPLADGSVLDASGFYQTSGVTRFQDLTPVPALKPGLLANLPLIVPAPNIILKTPHRNKVLFAATYGAFEQNQVVSADYSTTTNGYGGGFKLGMQKGKWGIETGIAYSNQRFSPKKDVNIYAGTPSEGFLGAYISEVQADVVSIPVKVNRRLAKIGRTSFRAVGGVTANVSTEKRYQYRQVLYPPLSPLPGNIIDPSANPIPRQNQNGTLEGGSVSSNTYVTADLSIRVEQPIGKRYVAFFEPGYRRALTGGFGPNREKVHTLSFQAGVMASL